jgi:SAM-dependent methyltransferase
LVCFRHGSEAWSFESWVARRVAAAGVRSVCDIGGGAKPLFSRRAIEDHDLDYVVVDRSEEELRKAPPGYETAVADVGGDGFRPVRRFDLVVTKTVLEHLEDPRRFHTDASRLLEPGGSAMHFFSTLYAPPFVLNRLLPERLSHRLLLHVQPGRADEGTEAKFRARYRWCRGPSRRQIERFESCGFHVDEYVGFFGHAYFERVPPLQRLEDASARFLTRHPLPWLTSYAWVCLSRR